jgi:predicted Fe-Mo cluster-binding NifX family protein
MEICGRRRSGRRFAGDTAREEQEEEAEETVVSDSAAKSEVHMNMTMKTYSVVAVPVMQDRLAEHFGHCDQFALIEIDPKTRTIIKETRETPPPHEPGLLPSWLAEKGADVIIAGGMGQRAQQLFVQNDINVVVGAPSETPEELVQKYLHDQLESGRNLCDH